MFLDVPNAFIQKTIPPKKDDKEREIIKTTDVIVDVLVELDSDMYRKHMVFENGKKVIYVVVLIKICGMPLSAILL